MHSEGEKVTILPQDLGENPLLTEHEAPISGAISAPHVAAARSGSVPILGTCAWGGQLGQRDGVLTDCGLDVQELTEAYRVTLA